MNVQRGDIVLLDYPYSSGGGRKVRPALVVQNDRDNRRLVNTVIVQITTSTRKVLEPTQLLVEIATPEGQPSGLRQDSVVNCVNILTLDKTKILRKLGRLPDSMLQKVNGCLNVALELVSDARKIAHQDAGRGKTKGVGTNLELHRAFHRGIAWIFALLTQERTEKLAQLQGDSALTERLTKLGEKASDDELTAIEQAEYEGYIEANNLLAVLQAEARYRLANREP